MVVFTVICKGIRIIYCVFQLLIEFVSCSFSLLLCFCRIYGQVTGVESCTIIFLFHYFSFIVLRSDWNWEFFNTIEPFGMLLIVIGRYEIAIFEPIFKKVEKLVVNC